MNEVNRYLIRLTKWTLLALVIVVTFSIVAKAQVDEASYGMDYDGVNPGMDKQCLSYKECPEWDGNPDTKVFYDLNKGSNGTGKVENAIIFNSTATKNGAVFLSVDFCKLLSKHSRVRKIGFIKILDSI